jgi:hypothetical protein
MDMIELRQLISWEASTPTPLEILHEPPTRYLECYDEIEGNTFHARHPSGTTASQDTLL